jgi:hypothetical protein
MEKIGAFSIKKTIFVRGRAVMAPKFYIHPTTVFNRNITPMGGEQVLYIYIYIYILLQNNVKFQMWKMLI